MADEFRDKLKAAISEKSAANSPVEQPQATEESQVESPESAMDGNTQSIEQTKTSSGSKQASKAADTEFAIGTGKYKTWDEARNSSEYKRLHELDKLWGRQANEVKALRDEKKKWSESKAAQIEKQWLEHPRLAAAMQKVYDDYNAELAGGATPKEAKQAATANISPELLAKIEKFDKFESEVREHQRKLQEQAFIGQVATRIDQEEKELKAAFPNDDPETTKAVMKYAQRFSNAVDPETGELAPMTLLEARQHLDSSIAAKKAPTSESKVAGRMASVKPTPKAQKDLAEIDENGKPTDAGRNNVKRLFKAYSNKQE